MAKKIAMGIMATIIVVFFGLSAYKSFFGQEKEPEKPKVDIFKNAMEKVDVSYVPYGESNGDCLLFVTNNNKFQINVAGTIVKEDENGVHHFVIDSFTATFLAKEIIRKHMNDGWIPVEERIPEVPDDMEDEYCPEFNVTIKGASRATTLKYSPDGAWFDDSGQVYVVIA